MTIEPVFATEPMIGKVCISKSEYEELKRRAAMPQLKRKDHAVVVSRIGTGRYSIDSAGKLYAVAYRHDGDNRGLWEVKIKGGIIGTESRLRDVVKCIDAGVY